MSTPLSNAPALPSLKHDLTYFDEEEEDEEEEDEEEAIIPMITMLAGSYTELFYNKTSIRNSILQEIDRVNELLHGHPRCF